MKFKKGKKPRPMKTTPAVAHAQRYRGEVKSPVHKALDKAEKT